MLNRQCLCGFARIAYNALSAPTLIAPNRAETANKPPIKFGHFPALLHAQNTFCRLRRAIQSSANPGKTTSKTFANLCHRNILTASRRTRNTTFIFMGRTARNSEIRPHGDTSCLCDRAANSALSHGNRRRFRRKNRTWMDRDSG